MVAKRVALAIVLIVIIAVIVWLLWPRFAPVPNLVGMSEETARSTIEGAGFSIGVVGTRTVDTTDAGQVVAQQPASGMRLTLGQTVDYWIAQPTAAAGEEAAGPPEWETETGPSGNVLVPGVVGKARADAENRIRGVGLVFRVALSASGEAAGEVIRQFPASGESVAPGSVVDLTVSTGTTGRGSASVRFNGASVPAVVGMTLASARSRLSGAGYGNRVVYAPSTSTDKGLVFWQSAGPGPASPRPGVVEIWVSSGDPTRGAPYPKPPDSAPFQ